MVGTAAINPMGSCVVGYSAATLAYLAVTRSLITPAWTPENLDDLFDRMMKGSDFDVPGAHGATPRARYRAVLIVSLRMWFSGYADRLGADAPDDDVTRQLQVNRRDFITNVVAPSAAADSTRLLSVTEADGLVVTAPCHVTDFEWRAAGARGLARGTLTLSIPAGRLA